MILKHVKRTIAKHHLFNRGQHVLVAVSGGADSMALLAALHELAPELGIRLTVAHLNHLIRGPTADEDERFVERVAGQLGIEFIAGRKDVKRLARRQGQSLEMAGREARYGFFASAARAMGCDVAATAHTADDQAETVLLRLSRGSGPRGLCGIPYVTTWKNLKIVRPLRDVDRKSIIRFLEQRRINWREDASNEDIAFLRNRVRHHILPALESKLNPQFRQALLRLSNVLEEENEWLDALAARILLECSAPAKPDAPGTGRGKGKARKIPADREDLFRTPVRVTGQRDLLCAALASYPLAARRRVLRHWLVSRGLPPETLDFEATERLNNLLSPGRPARAATLTGGWIVRREYDRLIARKGRTDSPGSYSMSLNIPGETLLPDQGFRITAALEPGMFREKPRGIGALPARASLNTGAWRRARITVRSWQPGDRMRPLGLRGSKKIQDIFTDLKVPKPWRCRVPLFECRGEIIWLPGFRIARGWDIPDTSTLALQLSLEWI